MSKPVEVPAKLATALREWRESIDTFLKVAGHDCRLSTAESNLYQLVAEMWPSEKAATPAPGPLPPADQSPL